MEEGHVYSMFHQEASALLLEKGEVLHGATCSYTVVEVLGEGAFGKVVECRKLDTLETVAIKVVKGPLEDSRHEIKALNTIGVLDPDHNNLVRFIECFETKGHTCLVLEKLDTTLYHLVRRQKFTPLGLDEVRDAAEQLLVALAGLQEVGVLHTDIKPDNIMVVRADEKPMRIKLVDFGLAGPVSLVYPGLQIQAIGYRAPEVCFGLPFSEMADVWGVGCVIAFLFLGNNLFPVHCEYQMVKSIIQLLGQPPDHQLAQGGFTRYFFTEEKVVGETTTWRLMTPVEFSGVNPSPAKWDRRIFQTPDSLDDLVQIHPGQDQSETEDRAALVDLLKGLLNLDGEQRLTPRAALQHPFITRSYRDQGPIPGPPQDPLSRPTLDPLGRLDPLDGPSEDPHALDPIDGPLEDPHALDPINGPPEDPHVLDPLDGPHEDPHAVDPTDGPTEDPLSVLDPFHTLEPLDGSPEDPHALDPIDGPPEDPHVFDPLDGPHEDPHAVDHIDSPPEDPFSILDPLHGSPEDLHALDPIDGPPEDLHVFDPLDGPHEDPHAVDHIDSPPEDPLSVLDPLHTLEPLDGSPEDPHALDSIASPPEDRLSVLDPLHTLELLDSPPEDPLSVLDPLHTLELLDSPPEDPHALDSIDRPPEDPHALDSIDGPHEDPHSMVDPLHTLELLKEPLKDPFNGPTEDHFSGPREDPLSGLDSLGGPSWAPNSGPSQISTSAGHFKRMKRRIRRAFQRLRNALLSCVRPQNDNS